MNKEKVAVIMNDKNIAAELAACKTLKEIISCLNKHGAECTDEEGTALVLAIKANAKKNEAMDMDAMEAVAGGNFITDGLDWLVDKFGLNMDYLTRPADPFENWDPTEISVVTEIGKPLSDTELKRLFDQYGDK